MRLVQFNDRDGERRVGIVGASGSSIEVIEGFARVSDIAAAAIVASIGIKELLTSTPRSGFCDYDKLIAERRLLPPLDHEEPARFWATGTGLTHVGSADARDRMHELAHEASDAPMTDSMKIFKMGIEGGKPEAGEVGVQPEWFFKGLGTSAVSPEADMPMPDFALSGGEEAEIVGLYLVGPDGVPYRIGFSISNEFSDQVTEAQNYLYLAHSKLRAFSFGPEIFIGELPGDVRGKIRVIRDGKAIWEGDFISGEDNMSHSIRNLEHYHFRYDFFRRPGDLHAYFIGASILSCAHGVTAEDGDLFEIDVPFFGRPLRNRLRRQPKQVAEVRSL